MLLFQYFFLLFVSKSLTLSLDVDFTFSYWAKDEQAISNINSVLKRFNLDNRHIVARLIEADCSAVSAPTCIPHTSSLQISNEKEGVRVLKEANIDELSKLSETAESLVYEFARELFSEYALDNSKKIDEQKWQDARKLVSKMEIDSIDQFNSLIAEDPNYVFVLFYESEGFDNFEAVLKTFEAVRKIKTIGGLVDCRNQADICENSEIEEHFPQLIAFHREDIYQKFDNDFVGDNVRDWILTLQQPDLTKLSEDAVPYYRSGIVPGFDDIRDTVTMLFIASKKSNIYHNYKNFARENHGKYHLTVMIDQQVAKWAHNPAFVTMKPRDEFIKAFTLYDDMSYDRMIEYLRDGLRPSIQDVSTAKNLIYASSTSSPLVVFFDPSSLRNSTNFRITASNSQIGIRNIFYAISKGLDLFSLFWVNQFVPDLRKPAYIVVDKKNDNYCIRWQLMANENQDQISFLVNDLNERECDNLIPAFKLPLEAIYRKERFDETEKLLTEQMKSFSSDHEEL